MQQIVDGVSKEDLLQQVTERIGEKGTKTAWKTLKLFYKKNRDEEQFDEKKKADINSRNPGKQRQ